MGNYGNKGPTMVCPYNFHTSFTQLSHETEDYGLKWEALQQTTVLIYTYFRFRKLHIIFPATCLCGRIKIQAWAALCTHQAQQIYFNVYMYSIILMNVCI